MRLTHPAYIKLVFGTYQMLRCRPECSPALKQPTPAGIRKECITVYKERPEKKDEPVLRAFFGPAGENGSFSTPIENFPTEKFKTLSNYLKGIATKTEDKNVELLAWLINFPYRPYRYGMEVILSDDEKAMVNSIEGAGENTDTDIEEAEEDISEEITVTPNANEPEAITMPTNAIPALEVPINSDGFGKKQLTVNKQWLMIGIPLIFGILSLGFYLLYDKDAQCMYWTGDHYEKIVCDTDMENKILFDEKRWKNFRKINNPDTITAWSIGKLYYLKTNGQLEYFTAGGNHPVYNTRSLHVLSPYMFNKYILAKAQKTPY